ncbi:TetR/AcrR family transcriptional regulator [Actinomadura scrupuli]|uniref:TetR/AcrR family transcriptional regulator n=1 Tax=Actinomadura scrupuli TaxID=559629 RepID=UPI003D9915F8
MTAAQRETRFEPEIVRDRVIETATRLFASLGYDGTSTQLIADAAGVGVATITELIGTKRDIYVAVMTWASLAEKAVFDAAFTEFTPDRAGIHMLADRYLDFCVDHPEVPALWLHRWQSDATDITELESMYVKPGQERITSVIQEFIRTEVDIEYALWTVSWCIHGFCVGGVINKAGRREGPHNTVLLRRFRAHLHQLIDRMLQLDR